MADTTCQFRYTIQDFSDISHDGFDYTIADATLDIISALASQVGAPDYVKTPNFSTQQRDVRGRGDRRRRKQQEMNDSDWEDLRTFHTKPKAEISPEKALEKQLRGELNKVATNCSRSQLESISTVMCEMLDADLGSVLVKVFFDLATCSKMNTTTFAQLFVDIVTKGTRDDALAEFLTESLRMLVADDGAWMSKFNVVEYVSEDVDYDKFCDLNRVNDSRLNMTRFIAKTFQLLFEEEDDRFEWFDQLGSCYWQMFCGFKDALRKAENEDVAMLYCANIIEFLQPIREYVEDHDDGRSFWAHAIEDQEQIIVSGVTAYPSLSRQIVFALQGAFNI